jgi:oligo-1,6-glucosidase
MYKKIQHEGGDLAYFIEGQKTGARDNGRTPFQWDSSANAGFSTGTPWLKVNPNYSTVNVEAEEKDPNSILHYFRKMVKIRKNHPALVYGKYDLLDKENKQVYAYTRTLGVTKYLVLLNFSKENLDYPLPISIENGHYSVIINNLIDSPPIEENKIKLAPYQALILELK